MMAAYGQTPIEFLISDYGTNSHLRSSLTPAEISHYARLVLLYDYKANSLEVCSQDALLEEYHLSFFELISFPIDLARPGLCIDIAGDRSYKILDMTAQDDHSGLVLIKDLNWMKESNLCRIARENGGMRHCFVYRDGVPLQDTRLKRKSNS